MLHGAVTDVIRELEIVLLQKNNITKKIKIVLLM